MCKGGFRGTLLWPLRPLKGSEVWALALYSVYKGFIRGPLKRAQTMGPCNYPKSMIDYGGLQ